MYVVTVEFSVRETQIYSTSYCGWIQKFELQLSALTTDRQALCTEGEDGMFW